MAKRKVRVKVSQPKLAHFVVVYEIREGDKMLLPGDVFSIPEKEVDEWRRYVEHRALVRMPSKEKAEIAAKAILDGTFQMAPDVEHSIAHGGFGK